MLYRSIPSEKEMEICYHNFIKAFNIIIGEFMPSIEREISQICTQ